MKSRADMIKELTTASGLFSLSVFIEFIIGVVWSIYSLVSTAPRALSIVLITQSLVMMFFLIMFVVDIYVCVKYLLNDDVDITQ